MQLTPHAVFVLYQEVTSKITFSIDVMLYTYLMLTSSHVEQLSHSNL